jgi:hypothetical protein
MFKPIIQHDYNETGALPIISNNRNKDDIMNTLMNFGDIIKNIQLDVSDIKKKLYQYDVDQEQDVFTNAQPNITDFVNFLSNIKEQSMKDMDMCSSAGSNIMEIESNDDSLMELKNESHQEHKIDYEKDKEDSEPDYEDNDIYIKNGFEPIQDINEPTDISSEPIQIVQVSQDINEPADISSEPIQVVQVSQEINEPIQDINEPADISSEPIQVVQVSQDINEPIQDINESVDKHLIKNKRRKGRRF